MRTYIESTEEKLGTIKLRQGSCLHEHILLFCEDTNLPKALIQISRNLYFQIQPIQ